MQELMDNPYINLYSRHGILVCDQLSNEEARQIASQAALIHQALGFVLKDLIRVVSFKYADDDDAGDAQSSQYMYLERLYKLYPAHKPKLQLSSRLNEILVYKDNLEEANIVIDDYARQPILPRNVISLDDDEQVEKIVVQNESIGEVPNFNRYAYNRKKASNGIKDRETLKCERCSRLADTVLYLGQKLCGKCLPISMEV